MCSAVFAQHGAPLVNVTALAGAARELQASTLSVCEDAMFVGRQTLAGGYGHTCALTTAGLVRCWGLNYHGETSVPASVAGVQQVVVSVGGGGYYTCSLSTEGLVTCWGYNADGQTSVPSASYNSVALSAGGAYLRLVVGRRGGVLGQQPLRSNHNSYCRVLQPSGRGGRL